MTDDADSIEADDKDDAVVDVDSASATVASETPTGGHRLNKEGQGVRDIAVREGSCSETDGRRYREGGGWDEEEVEEEEADVERGSS